MVIIHWGSAHTNQEGKQKKPRNPKTPIRIGDAQERFMRTGKESKDEKGEKHPLEGDKRRPGISCFFIKSAVKGEILNLT